MFNIFKAVWQPVILPLFGRRKYIKERHKDLDMIYSLDRVYRAEVYKKPCSMRDPRKNNKYRVMLSKEGRYGNRRFIEDVNYKAYKKTFKEATQYAIEKISEYSR